MQARHLRKGDVLVHDGHRLRIIAVRKKGLWKRTVIAYGVYEPGGAPATYVLAAHDRVTTS
jgi:hypothetical protein